MGEDGCRVRVRVGVGWLRWVYFGFGIKKFLFYWSLLVFFFVKVFVLG